MKLDEIAKLAGVSCTTVSYVVNGKAKQYRVSDSTIAKVQALISNPMPWRQACAWAKVKLLV